LPQLEAISKEVVKQLGAHWIGLDKAFREERAGGGQA
jgi:hypothetical protein